MRRTARSIPHRARTASPHLLDELEPRSLLAAGPLVGPNPITILDSARQVQATAVVQGLTGSQPAVLAAIDESPTSAEGAVLARSAQLRITWQENGRLMSRRVATVPANVTEFSVADINRDGIDDVIARGFGATGDSLYVLIGQPSGPSGAKFRLTQILRAPQGINFALGNLDADQELELVTNERITADRELLSADRLRVYHLTGSQFSLVKTYANHGTPFLRGYVTQVAIADLDNDGDNDVLVAGQPGYFIVPFRADLLPPPGGLIMQSMINNGNATFRPGAQTQLAFGAGARVTLADVDGDHVTDALITSGQYETGVFVGQNNRVDLARGLGTGGFSTTLSTVAEFDPTQAGLPADGRAGAVGTVVGVRDVDGDGDLDVLLAARYTQPGPLTLVQPGIIFDPDADVVEPFTRTWFAVATNDSHGGFTVSSPRHLTQFPDDARSTTGFGFIDFDADGMLDAIRRVGNRVDVVRGAFA